MDQKVNIKAIKVIIADDHAIVRRGINHILSDEKDILVVGEASNTNELMGQLCSKKCDVLILDITMPGKSGLDALIEIKQKYPGTKVLILTMYSEKEIAIRAIKTGASGYLSKDSMPGEILKAIKQIYRSGRYLSPDLAEAIVFSFDKHDSDLDYTILSEREFQVMCLIASGNSLKQIAEELELSVKTISTFRTRILEKMNMKSNVEIAHYAIKHNLVVPFNS